MSSTVAQGANTVKDAVCATLTSPSPSPSAENLLGSVIIIGMLLPTHERLRAFVQLQCRTGSTANKTKRLNTEKNILTAMQ